MFAVLSHAPGISLLLRGRPAPSGGLRRRLAGLVGGVLPRGILGGVLGGVAPGGARGYRPERHYMRGGTTPGSRCLTAAHDRIAGRG